jgi:hypothetical protein
MADFSMFGNNPYIKQQAQNIQDQSNANLNNNVMPAIGQGAQVAGQYGGSRQGVAQGVAAAQAQNGINAAQANLYSNAYGQDQNFYTAQRGQDQAGVQLGANIYNMGNQGNLGIGQGQYNLGQQYQNAPLTALQQYSNTISPYSGLNSTQTGVSSSGGGALGMMGGALAGAQIYNNLGFGGGVQMPTSPYAGYGTNYNNLAYQP